MGIPVGQRPEVFVAVEALEGLDSRVDGQVGFEVVFGREVLQAGHAGELWLVSRMNPGGRVQKKPRKLFECPSGFVERKTYLL